MKAIKVTTDRTLIFPGKTPEERETHRAIHAGKIVSKAAEMFRMQREMSRQPKYLFEHTKDLFKKLNI